MHSRCVRLSILLGLVALVALSACTAVNRVSVDRKVEFAKPGGEPLSLDAYLPSGDGPHPVILLIHGGGWSQGSRRDLTPEGFWFADRGIAAFSIDYRLAPDHPFPAALEDVKSAVEFIRAKANLYKLDAKNVAAFGPSAGGHLAALLAVVGEGSLEGGSRIKAAISLSGTMDIASSLTDSRESSLEEVRKLVGQFLDCDVSSCAGPIKEASPINHVDARDAPIFLAHSQQEALPIAQAQAMAERLEEHGVPHLLVSVSGGSHGEELSRAVLVESRESLLDAAFGFLIGRGLQPAPAESRLTPGSIAGLVALTLAIPALVLIGALISNRLRRLAIKAGLRLARGPLDPAAIAMIDSMTRTGASPREVWERLAMAGYVVGKQAGPVKRILARLTGRGREP